MSEPVVEPAREEMKTITFPFMVRPGMVTQIVLPAGYTEREMERLRLFIASLPDSQ